MVLRVCLCEIDVCSSGKNKQAYLNLAHFAQHAVLSDLEPKQSQHTDLSCARLPVNDINRQTVCRFAPHDLTLCQWGSKYWLVDAFQTKRACWHQATCKQPRNRSEETAQSEERGKP